MQLQLTFLSGFLIIKCQSIYQEAFQMELMTSFAESITLVIQFRVLSMENLFI